MTKDANPRTRISPRLVLYGLGFRAARAAWSLGGRAVPHADNYAPGLAPASSGVAVSSGPGPQWLEWEAVPGSAPRPERG